MFLDGELSPELAQQIWDQQVVIAHNYNEALQRARQLSRTRDFGAPAEADIYRLDAILRIWKDGQPSWSRLKGIRVLDLAAGSSLYDGPLGRFHPHFARLCAINGADVLAIDILPQVGIDQQLFKSVQADLVDAVLNGGLSGLPALQGREFDLIYSSGFVGFNCAEELPSQLSPRGVTREEFEGIFLNQAGHFLAQDGIMMLGTADKHHSLIFYTRKGTEVIELPKISPATPKAPITPKPSRPFLSRLIPAFLKNL